jgi:hypothetical protein
VASHQTEVRRLYIGRGKGIVAINLGSSGGVSIGIILETYGGMYLYRVFHDFMQYKPNGIPEVIFRETCHTNVGTILSDYRSMTGGK